MFSKKLNVESEGELIVKIPREMLPDMEKIAKERGFKDSRELLANFVKKQLSMLYKVDKDDFRFKEIH
jgi:hypothetical protein